MRKGIENHSDPTRTNYLKSNYKRNNKTKVPYKENKPGCEEKGRF